jgi:phosphoglycerate-specific signal transduction histidine kinase
MLPGPGSRFPGPRSQGELVSQLAVASLGAGVITSLAVAQGQNPLTALGITLFSAVAAVMVGQVI